MKTQRLLVEDQDRSGVKNIWAFHHYEEGPNGHWTGTSDLYRPIAARGHKVTIFASSYSHHARKEMHLQPGQDVVVEHHEGMRFVFVRTRPYDDYGTQRGLNMIDFYRGARRFADADPERPDVCVGSTPHPICALTAARTASKKRAKFFFEIHDIWPLFMIEAKVWKPTHPMVVSFGLLERYLLRKADLVSYLWLRGDEYLKKMGVASSRMLWVPMGMSEDDLSQLPREQPMSDSPFIVTYSGRLGATAAADGILEAAEILQRQGHAEIQIRLISEGERKTEFQESAQRMGLCNVIFEPFVPRSQVRQNLLSSHVLFGGLPALPSYRDYGPIPTKLIDYLALGRPIIYATDDPRHVVAKAGAGLVVPPNDPPALATAILTLRNMSRADRTKLGIAGQEYLRKNHNVEKIATDLLERV